MGILAFIAIGFVVGLVSQAIIPGSHKLGLFASCILGAVGSLVGGGVLGSLFDSRARAFELAPLDITLAVLVAGVVLFAVGLANSRRAHV
jgi:uncharacterized membrane protein YeaQ/YmgE (transglycosylase-associated protein family)